MSDKAKKPKQANAEDYQRGDFFRDLKKASRKLVPEERQPKKKPSGRSGGKS